MEKFNLRYLKPSVYVFFIVLLALLLYIANEFILSHWGISFSIFAVIGGILTIINSYLWNIKPFSWMYSVLDFSGRYEGTLSYKYRDENCKEASNTLTHIKVIAQNGSDIVINSWTRKKDDSMSSPSTSIEASIIKQKDGTFSLIYNYLNEGNGELAFSPHYGTEVLKLITTKSNKKHLTGRYYTERLPYQTMGKIDLEYKSKDLTHEK